MVAQGSRDGHGRPLQGLGLASVEVQQTGTVLFFLCDQNLPGTSLHGFFPAVLRGLEVRRLLGLDISRFLGLAIGTLLGLAVSIFLGLAIGVFLGIAISVFLGLV